MKTKNKVIRILSEYTKKDKREINEKSSLANDLGLDSLDTLELALIFEEEFNITIDRDSYDGEGTVGDIISYLERK